MPVLSAGLLMYRRGRAGMEVLLVHMGGPFWAKKDLGAWSIPKGLVVDGEEPLAAAIREFREETGFAVTGPYNPLGTFRQNSKKDLAVWAVEGDCDHTALTSNTFTMTWPPNSGILQEFPEADRAGWFGHEDALKKAVKGQWPVLEQFFNQS